MADSDRPKRKSTPSLVRVEPRRNDAAHPADTGVREARLPDVSSIFGVPYQVGGKTLIPVAQARYVFARQSKKKAGLPGAGPRLSNVRPVAVIEVDNGKVRVVNVSNPLPLVLASLLLGAWNVYWILKTVREWRAGRV